MAEAHALMKLMVLRPADKFLLLSRKGDRHNWDTGTTSSSDGAGLDTGWTNPCHKKEPRSPSHMAGHMWRQKLHLV